MLDTMLVAHRCAPLAKARFCRVPDAPMQPTIWVNPDGALSAWHPLMPDALHSDGVSDAWTQQNFAPLAQQLVEGLREHLHDLLEESGAPASYFSNYPSVVADLRRGQANFTIPADDDDAQQDPAPSLKKPIRPSLDVLLKGMA